MKLASILRDLINKLLGREQSRPAAEPTTHNVNVEIEGNSESYTTTIIHLDESDEPSDEAPFPKEDIMKEIKRLIKGEDKTNPLYDTEIHTILVKEGYDLVSRTVTRYRKEMDIENRKERLEDYRDDAKKKRKRKKKDSCD